MRLDAACRLFLGSTWVFVSAIAHANPDGGVAARAPARELLKWPTTERASPIRLAQVKGIEDQQYPEYLVFEWVLTNSASEGAPVRVKELGIAAARQVPPDDSRKCICHSPHALVPRPYFVKLELGLSADRKHLLKLRGPWISHVPKGSQLNEMAEGVSWRGGACCEPPLHFLDLRLPASDLLLAPGASASVLLYLPKDSFGRFERPQSGNPPKRSVLGFLVMDDENRLVRDPDLSPDEFSSLLRHELIQTSTP